GLVGPMSPGPTGPTWHRLWLRLHEWAPVFGHHHTLRHWFSEAYASERPTRLRCDDFTVDGLVRRAEGKLPGVLRDLPALHAAEAERQAGRNLAALLAWLGPAPPDSDDLGTAATALAQRMVAKAEPEAVGYMVLNPCGMPRTVTAKLPGATTPMPRPARASKVDAGAVEVVVDLPPFGYAWLPRAIAPGTRILMPQGELAHSQCVQNDLIEAWVDAATGGLRDLRQPGARAGRLGQQLVYQPGSRMVARSVRIASTGPIRGEIVCEGDLLDAEGQVRAQFRQTFTVCWGQPYLHLCIELEPRRLPSGYAWQDYFGCRWAWSDPTALLARPTGWLLEASGAARIESPLGLELHSSAGRTGLLTRGLAYHQRVGERMLDVILIAPGETRRTFDLTVALEPDDLVMAAADVLAPAPVVEVAAGPPRSGPTGWLFDLEAVNVWLMDVTQPSGSEVEPGSLDLHLAEVRGAAVQTRLRCCRSVATATVVNELGTTQQTLPVSSTEVELNLAAWERLRVRLTFGGNAPLPSLPAT
ncbi:MAG TPA: hypothetical protein PKD86_19205, partial [Gemmatales bacterium]|nr:hypothetical protein [Gemmatales bacterium]